MDEPRKEFLDLALSCGAKLTGKPDGTEAITVVFTTDAWRAFDAACLSQTRVTTEPVKAEPCGIGGMAKTTCPWCENGFSFEYQPDTTEHKGEPGLFATEVQPQPLRYSLDDYHRAPSEGPLKATWQDKPHRLLYDLVAALAYYTSPQATERKGPLSKDQIREIFLTHGFTVKDGQTDLKPYVYDAAYALLTAAKKDSS